MKLKMMLLSVTMILSMLGGSSSGIDKNALASKQETKVETGTETTEDEVREDASHTGETEEEKDSDNTDKSEDKEKDICRFCKVNFRQFPFFC